MNRLQKVIRRRDLVFGSPNATVLETVITMTEGRVGAIPILENDVLVGIFSERDLLRRVVAVGRDPAITRIRDVMTGDVVTATLDEAVDACLDKMKRAGCRHLPIESDGRVIAMIAMRDLLRDEIEEQTDELRFLRAYVHQAPLRS
jgi:CBS domain-containing protein